MTTVVDTLRNGVDTEKMLAIGIRRYRINRAFGSDARSVPRRPVVEPWIGGRHKTSPTTTRGSLTAGASPKKLAAAPLLGDKRGGGAACADALRPSVASAVHGCPL